MMQRHTAMRGAVLRAIFAAACCIAGTGPVVAAPAEPADPAGAAAPGAEEFAVHGQATNVIQWHPRFASPYAGPNSLRADGRAEETTDLTLYGGRRLWQGAELWLNAEVDQGFGLSNTVGVAGFPSGEAYKVGANAPYLRLPRAFVRQVFALGGGAQRRDAGPNQLAASGTADSVVLTAGKFSVVDIFDANAYAHDPRVDFLNWSVIDAGAFDYAADAWGYTYGAALEWNQGDSTLRGGVFQLSPVPNGKVVAPDFSQSMAVAEWERRLQWRGRPGKMRVLAFVNRARMGSYREAVALAGQAGSAPDMGLVRRRGARAGVALNVEQELADGVGFFARASANDGAKEAYEFTEINRSLSAGVQLAGAGWGRARDRVGIALAVNALSPQARTYFAAGGLGILIGDGRLRYGTESIAEAYYALAVAPGVALTFDYQHVANPAYNRDRGPVSVYGLRLHAEF